MSAFASDLPTRPPVDPVLASNAAGPPPGPPADPTRYYPQGGYSPVPGPDGTGYEPRYDPRYERPGPPTRTRDSRDAAGGPGDRFANAVAIVIALMSIVSAIVAWRASEAANEAQDLDNRAVQELAQVQQARQSLEGVVTHERRLVSRYQAHLGAAAGLRTQADGVRAENSELADVLELQAHAEDAQAQILFTLFTTSGLGFDDAGNATFDAERALRDLTSQDETLVEVRPEQTQAQADQQDRKSLALVGTAAVIIGSLFFLTIASIGARRLRLGFGAVGAVAAVAGLILFALVEIGA